MHSYGARISVAALSSVAVIGVLAGCGAQSLNATVTGPKAAATDSALAADAKPTPTPTDTAVATPTSTPTAVATTAASAPAPTTTTAPAPVKTTAPVSTPTPTPPATIYTYANGNYSSLGGYNSPGGHETLRVTVDLKNDVITALAVTSVAIDHTAANYEAAFEGGIQAIVVGKDIDSLHVGPVAGSSLTSIGFDRAIESIKSQAKN